MRMEEQIIRLSEGCPYSCAFCFNGKVDFKDLPMVKKDVEVIVNELKSLAENKKAEMSANVYEYIWNMIQGLEHKD